MGRPLTGPVNAVSGDDERLAPTNRDPRTGRFVGGNRAAAKTDGPGVPGLDADVQAFLEHSLADDGGGDQMSTRRLSQHQYRAVVHGHILQLNAALETSGLFDPHGKMRLAWLSKLESLIREARALDQSLGLARRAKTVSLDDYVRSTYVPDDTGTDPTPDDDPTNEPPSPD